jgi:hypothetical protein
LPDPSEQQHLVKGIAASLAITMTVPNDPGLGFALMAAPYCAVINEVLPCDFSIFLAGSTGTRKTALSALLQGHFGTGFSHHQLPCSWSSTANALEYVAFQGKDVIVTIDDFCPRGTHQDIEKLHKTAETIFRGAGNKQGRQRLNADMQQRETYFPRGLLMASGEEIPKGHSLRARLLVLQVHPETVDLDQLSSAQRDLDAGLFAHALAGFIQWLAPQVDTLRKTLPEQKRQLRDAMQSSLQGHSRTSDQFASLFIGVDMFLRYADQRGVLGDLGLTYEELLADGKQHLVVLFQQQHLVQREADPVSLYIETLTDAFSSGKAHLENRDDSQPGSARCLQWGWKETRDEEGNTVYTPAGGSNSRHVGWMDTNNPEEIYLLPAPSFALVVDVLKSQQITLPLSREMLCKHLVDKKIIKRKDDNQCTIQMRIKGRGKLRVLCLDAKKLDLSMAPQTRKASAAGDGENVVSLF